MLALYQYEADVHACGFHKSVLADPENNVMVPDEEHCDMCAQLAMRARVQAAEDQAAIKQLGKDPDPKKRRPSDGRRTFLRPATPEERAERAARKNREMTRQARTKTKTKAR